MIPVVTAATPDYFPGVRALAASFENAGPGFRLYCICYGDLADDCREIGVEPIEPVDWAEQYPGSDIWAEGPPASYSRLNVPRMFPGHDRVIWLDADAIIRGPLTELAELRFEEPVATVFRADKNFSLAFQVRGILAPGIRGIRCTCNGLMVFNVPEWNRLGVTEQCAKAMARDDLVFRYVDQSVLSYVLMDNWYRLDHRWICFANRIRPDHIDAPILVWAGGVPWRDEVGNTDIWESYASRG